MERMSVDVLKPIRVIKASRAAGQSSEMLEAVGSRRYETGPATAKERSIVISLKGKSALLPRLKVRQDGQSQRYCERTSGSAA